MSDREQVEGTKHYVWGMNNEKGDRLIATERNGLNELLNSATLSLDKLVSFQIRVHVLGVFCSSFEPGDRMQLFLLALTAGPGPFSTKKLDSQFNSGRAS
jgi:hypothetical protein